MKALGKFKAEEGIWLEPDAATPDIKDNEVLIRIKKTSICGTDMHIYGWDDWARENVPVPLITGHEYMGTIEKLGADVTHLKIGQRVSGEGHLICGICRNCRAGKRHFCRQTKGIGVNVQGAFAEYLALPAENVVQLPDDIPDEIGAILDPLGNAVHTALAFDLIGEDVLIAGAGPIGMMAAAICKHVGARHIVITDMNPYRLDLAKQMGATTTVDISKQKLKDVMQDIGMTEGFDVGLEMSGNQNAIRDMIHNMNTGGKIALLGIPPEDITIDWNEIIFKGLTLKGIYGREMYETWYKMIAMLQSGLDVSPIITHQFKADEFQKGFDVMKTGQSGKVVLDWD